MSALRPWLAATVLVAVVGCETPPPIVEAPTAIIGGQPSSSGRYPSAGVLWILQANGAGVLWPLNLCSATLIRPDVVLTAAHCVEFDPDEVSYAFANDFAATDAFGVGPQGVVLNPNAYGSVETVMHPRYQPQFQEGLSGWNDIALVFLDRPVVGITPAELPTAFGQPSLATDAPISIVGYGQRDFESSGADPTDVLKYEGDTRVTEEGTTEIRVGRTSRDAPLIPQKCHGDSGGPSFVVRPGQPPVVVGVTSRAYSAQDDCRSGGVDTRVDAYLPWIQREIDLACEQQRRPGTAAEPCPPVQVMDAGVPEAGFDAGPPDLGSEDFGVAEVGVPRPDGGIPPGDGGFIDAGHPDLGLIDAGTAADAGQANLRSAPARLLPGRGGCRSGASSGIELPVLALGLLALLRRRKGRA